MKPIDRLISPLQYQNPKVQATPLKNKNDFKTAFSNALNQQAATPLKISKHAAERMAERNISIKPEEWRGISEKLKEAKAMGINESLVIMKNQALVVSAQNETVITVMNRNEASSQIFSNINGAILLDN